VELEAGVELLAGGRHGEARGLRSGWSSMPPAGAGKGGARPRRASLMEGYGARRRGAASPASRSRAGRRYLEGAAGGGRER
jgi:hypothetical protein